MGGSQAGQGCRWILALWERGASNAGDHDLGCVKTFALMGKAFAETTLKVQVK